MKTLTIKQLDEIDKYCRRLANFSYATRLQVGKLRILLDMARAYLSSVKQQSSAKQQAALVSAERTACATTCREIAECLEGAEAVCDAALACREVIRLKVRGGKRNHGWLVVPDE
jgi:hypothetical protein